jgi:hypothetical protein
MLTPELAVRMKQLASAIVAQLPAAMRDGALGAMVPDAREKFVAWLQSP